jgi:hypothetical protein
MSSYLAIAAQFRITNVKLGVYRISSTLVLYSDTQLVGELSTSLPVLQAATTFIGDALITCDVYVVDGHSEWFLNTVSLFVLSNLLPSALLNPQEGTKPFIQ